MTDHTPSTGLRFRILGDLRVEGVDGPLSLTSHRQRATLVMLLLAANREVAVDRLAQAIWDESPPLTARDQIQICVSMLRKRFAQSGVAASIVTGTVGYSIRVDPDALDALVFERLTTCARRALEQGQRARAERDFHAAVGLWPAGGNFPTGSQVLDSIAAAMTEKRLTATEEWAAVRLGGGEPDGVVPILVDLVAQHPLRERLCGLLMRALHRSGRRAEALEVYRTCRAVLVDELGIEPGEELRRVQQQIIADTPTTSTPPRVPVPRHDAAGVGELSIALSAEDKVLLVLRLLSGDLTVDEAAGTYRQPEGAIELWQRQFLDGGRVGLTEQAEPGGPQRERSQRERSQRERDLSDRVADLTSALGEAHVELRSWKRKALAGDQHLRLAT
ncbi:AfsR/SARP family transcriptional regulator [Actinokineospora diospyrosa]|uniref:DNA-binding transcriptional activator of the SARP family n=1 Tax=Actinokineospora diospyrosa TaxID=103728 RepID=A0ABT1IEX1_9PSEU|nr:AfsR/SARP family transcriptional regulator [Actinokineospora diospyrosa]MCP2271160.1 DNA-binding transcriptional activator of the SARP family [Actinokineospora diospyrosa]